MLLAAVVYMAGCRSEPPMVDPTLDLGPGAFLAGHWSAMHETDHGLRYSEELWLPFTADGSLGINRTTIAGKTVFYEFLRIETSNGETVYIAHPKGRSPGTRFTMIETSDNRVVFENPDHDFPQRIIYERLGDELHAQVEGTQNGERRVERWIWRRARN